MMQQLTLYTAKGIQAIMNKNKTKRCLAKLISKSNQFISYLIVYKL